jgi:hypothetical protein
MTSRKPLPLELAPIFAVGTALERGVSLHRLEAADLRRPFHGTRVPSSMPAAFETRCRALATKFRPGDAFTGPTAARLWRMPLPLGVERSPLFFVVSLPPFREMRRAGVVGSTRSETTPVTLSGIPLMPVWETCLSLAAALRRDDLVAVIDFVVTGDRGKSPLSTLRDLDDFLLDHAGHPGIVSLRRARALARRGAWSRQETRLRLLVVRAGIPEPVLNERLIHPSGRLLIPDLGWPDYRVAAEYNGIHHDEPGERVHDLSRLDDFVDIGWSTVNVERKELAENPRSIVARLTRRLTERGWMPPQRLDRTKSASW